MMLTMFTQPHGTPCFCIDHRKANTVTKPDLWGVEMIGVGCVCCVIKSDMPEDCQQVSLTPLASTISVCNLSQSAVH